VAGPKEEVTVRNALRAVLLGVLACCLSACAVTVPVGEPVYEPPVVVAEPPVSVWVWTPWPHYEVEHHYAIENDRVIIHDRHYTPFYGRTHRYIRNDQGNHRGWYKHER
jgi:hypothetical protein